MAIATLAAVVFSSCVSKKKYMELEEDYNNTRSNLQQTQMEKEQLEERLGNIEERVVDYNARINALRDESNSKARDE